MAHTSFIIEKQWVTDAGLLAVIVKFTERYLQHRCGYVGVGIEHEGFAFDYEEVDIDAHGGITYTGDNSTNYPITTDKPTWWFGFDCAHAGDDEPGGRSLDYCIAQCESIAKQLEQ